MGGDISRCLQEALRSLRPFNFISILAPPLISNWHHLLLTRSPVAEEMGMPAETATPGTEIAATKETAAITVIMGMVAPKETKGATTATAGAKEMPGAVTAMAVRRETLGAVTARAVRLAIPEAREETPETVTVTGELKGALDRIMAREPRKGILAAARTARVVPPAAIPVGGRALGVPAAM